MYIPIWLLVLLFVCVAYMAYQAGAQAIRAEWRKSKKARREKRRLKKEQKEEEAAWQQIRKKYGEDLDDEALMMIHDFERDPYMSEDTKGFAIMLEIRENRRRQNAEQEERHD